MSTKSEHALDNLRAATENILSDQHLLAISGDGSDAHPGIEADNRLIRGQVFLWPEANADWRVLWDDSQIFETRDDYAAFQAAR